MRERRVDHRRLAEWALYRNVDWGSSETLVEKVHSLLPGHWMQLRHGRPSAPRPYYVVEAQVDPATLRRPRQAVGARDHRGDRVAGRHRGARPPGQRRAGRHALQRRHRFQPDHRARGPRPPEPPGVPRLGRWLPGARREPLCEAGDRCAGPRSPDLPDGGRRTSGPIWRAPPTTAISRSPTPTRSPFC